MASKKPENKAASDQALAQFEQDFRGVAALADQTETSDTNTHDLLAQTLDAMFAFGQRLRQNEKLMENFFVSKGIKFNKTTRENPYNGLVKRAFGDKTKKAMQSKYARALHFVHDSKLNERVEDWVKTKGIEACYKMASDHFGGPKRERNKFTKEQQVQLGQQALANISASAPFALNNPLPGGYVRALLRVGDDGLTAEVVDTIATGAGEWDRIFASYSTPHAGLLAHLSGFPLVPLYRAMELVSALAPSTGSDHILLRQSDTATIIEFAGTAHSFRAAHMELQDRLAEFPSGAVLTLPLQSARDFVMNFPRKDDWAIISQNGQFAIVSAALNLRYDWVPPPKRISVGNFTGQRSKHFQLPLSNLSAAAQEKMLLSPKIDSSNRRPPARLKMTVDDKTLSVENAMFKKGWPMALLDMKASGATFADHREIDRADLELLDAVLTPLQLNIVGSFVAHDTPDAAILLEISMTEGHLKISVPLVIDARMHRAKACVAL